MNIREFYIYYYFDFSDLGLLLKIRDSWMPMCGDWRTGADGFTGARGWMGLWVPVGLTCTGGHQWSTVGGSVWKSAGGAWRKPACLSVRPCWCEWWYLFSWVLQKLY